MTKPTAPSRRTFGLAALGLAALPFAASRASAAQAGAGANASFGALKQVAAGDLSIGYAEAGPANGKPVVLLHGWPYDIHSFVEVAPLLAAAGYRVIVPHLRGYGTTRFLSNETVRNGQQAVFAVDVIALMDALKIPAAIVAGFDWGARTANIVAALWPDRCNAMVSVSGLSDRQSESERRAAAAQGGALLWYQFYFATERGRLGYDANRSDFARLIWQTASPTWKFDDATFARSAAALDNPDHVAIVIHNYRWRLGVAQGEARYGRAGGAARDRSEHRRADDHDGRGCQWRAASRSGRLCGQILWPIQPPSDWRRHRPQSAAGGAAGLCPGGHRRRSLLIGERSIPGLFLPAKLSPLYYLSTARFRLCDSRKGTACSLCPRAADRKRKKVRGAATAEATILRKEDRLESEW